MKHIFRTSALPLVLIPSLVISPIWAQSALTASSRNSEASNIRLRVIEEPKANAGSVPAKALTVQVRDESGNPVQDAAVAFRLPDTSASGTFADGTQSAVAYTDASGTAHVEGIRWIASSGTVPVRITASKGNSHAGLLFEEKLSASAAAVPTPMVRAEEASVKPPQPSFTPTVLAPGVAALDQPKVPVVPAPGELAAVAPAPRPSVSISTFSKSSSANANSFLSNVEPSVSISSSPQGYSNHSSLKKWLIWTAVAAAAGAGAAVAFSGKSSSGAITSSSTSTIGAPTINIGH
jgi:hypothetical protein